MVTNSWIEAGGMLSHTTVWSPDTESDVIIIFRVNKEYIHPPGDKINIKYIIHIYFIDFL